LDSSRTNASAPFFSKSLKEDLHKYNKRPHLFNSDQILWVNENYFIFLHSIKMQLMGLFEALFKNKKSEHSMYAPATIQEAYMAIFYSIL